MCNLSEVASEAFCFFSYIMMSVNANKMSEINEHVYELSNFLTAVIWPTRFRFHFGCLKIQIFDKKLPELTMFRFRIELG